MPIPNFGKVPLETNYLIEYILLPIFQYIIFNHIFNLIDLFYKLMYDFSPITYIDLCTNAKLITGCFIKKDNLVYLHNNNKIPIS